MFRLKISIFIGNARLYWIIKDFIEKIVEEKRGGFCYELNGLFYELLEEIGFQSKIISARVSQGKGEFGAEYDHLAIFNEN